MYLYFRMTGQLSALGDKLIMIGEDLSGKPGWAKMFRYWLRSSKDEDCWQYVSAPREGVETLNLVAELLERELTNIALSRMYGWLLDGSLNCLEVSSFGLVFVKSGMLVCVCSYMWDPRLLGLETKISVLLGLALNFPLKRLTA